MGTLKPRGGPNPALPPPNPRQENLSAPTSLGGGHWPSPVYCRQPREGGSCPHRSHSGGGQTPFLLPLTSQFGGVPSEPNKSQFWEVFRPFQSPLPTQFKLSSEPPDPFRGFLQSSGSPGGDFRPFSGSLSLLWGPRGSRCSAQVPRGSGSATSGGGTRLGPLPTAGAAPGEAGGDSRVGGEAGDLTKTPPLPPARASRWSRKGFRGSRRVVGRSRGSHRGPGGFPRRGRAEVASRAAGSGVE